MARITLLIALFLLLAGNASAQQATDTPRKGEGISAFLKRNGRTGKAYHKEFLQLNKKRLRGKEELLLGVKYILPPLQEKGNDEGKKGGRKKKRSILVDHGRIITDIFSLQCVNDPQKFFGNMGQCHTMRFAL